MIGPVNDLVADVPCKQRHTVHQTFERLIDEQGFTSGYLAQPLGLGLDNVEHLVAERADQLSGIDRADAPDHPGAQILLDALDGRRLRGADEARPELLAVGAVVHPLAGGGNPLPGRHHGRVADHGDQFAMAPRPGPQHAEPVLGMRRPCWR